MDNATPTTSHRHAQAATASKRNASDDAVAPLRRAASASTVAACQIAAMSAVGP